MRKLEKMSLWCLWGQWLLVLSVVLYGLFRAHPPVQLWVAWEDKAQHFVAFAGLVFSSMLVLRSFLWVTLAGVLLATGSEWLQPIISPLRLGSVSDAVANVIGISFGLVFFLIWQRTQRN